jgi:large conductance mechanosensitive channel
MSMVKEFKEFAANGSFIDLAIGVLIGGAFAPVINAFVNKFILAIVAAIFGKPNFDNVLSFRLGSKAEVIDGVPTGLKGTLVQIGPTITALFSFLIIMFVAFLILKAVAKMGKGDGKVAVGPTQVDLLTEIRDSLRAR